MKENNKYTNIEIIDGLKEDIKSKINFQDELINTNNLYGLFINDNTFMIAKGNTTKHQYCTSYIIENFITSRLISYGVIEHSKGTKAPWENEFMNIKNSDLTAFVIPVKELLNKHIKNGVTTKKNIVALFDTVNEYIKENPNFIDSLFTENVRKR